MFKKTTTSLLILASILLSTAACSSTDTTDGTQTTVGENADTTAIETVDNGRDNLPDDLDFGGYNWRAWSSVADYYHGEIKMPEENGDAFNDARYEYARKVEERLNITISEITSDSVNDPKVAMLAGEDAYDIVTHGAARAIGYAKEKLTYILDDLTYVDLDRPYWDADVASQLSINNKNYFLTAPFNLQIYDFMTVLAFNKEMVTNFELSNPYELVKTDDWTIDNYTEMAVAITDDINGDGTFDENDRYGLICMSKTVLPAFWIAAGERTVAKDEDDRLYFAALGNERFASVIEKIFTVTWDNNSWNAKSSVATDFKNNKSLFYATILYNIKSLRDMETDFGILPFPKYDETQEEYYSRLDAVYLFSVPVTNSDIDRTSAVIEALACEAYYTVLPAYYDIMLKGKIARDNESSEMLDLMFGSRLIDFGDCIWHSTIRDGLFSGMFASNNRETASKIASIEHKVNDLLEETMDAYEDLE